jgi:GNAT superfamily N-acetyltransferase
VTSGRYLLDKFFDLNQGIYFDRVQDLNYAKVYTSDNISNEYNNHAELISLEVDKERRLNRIEQVLLKAGRKPAIYITPLTRPEKIDTILKDSNYNISFNDAWMVMIDPGRLQEINQSLEVIYVNNDKTILDEFRRINALGFSGEKTPENPYGDLDPNEYANATIKGLSHLKKSMRFEGYLFKYKGNFVACSFLISDGQAGYISGVACIPQARGKGLGKTASLYATKRSLEIGNRITFLATEQGSWNEEFYRRLGFETQFTGTCYIKGGKS